MDETPLSNFFLSHNRTLYEVNGELINEDGNTSQIIDSDISKYPQVRVTSDNLLRSTLTMNETARSAFLEHSETLVQKVTAAWYGHGLTGVLQEICESSSDEVSPQVKNFCQYLLVSLRWLSGMKFTLFPHLKLASDDLIDLFSENVDWCASPIRYLAWHSRADKFALALKDDTIRIYYSSNDLVPMLKHKLQRNVSVMAWKPLSASTLAVGTQAVILIWTIDPASLSTRPSASAAQVLSYPGHSPITSIAWCPHGSDKLYSVSALNTALVVWSVAAKEYQVIQYMTTSGGVSRISFSPDGSKMLAATPGSTFRIFETASWCNERWSRLEGRMQASCWTPDGTFLLFALYGDPRIYSISFPDSNSFDLPVVDGSKHASVAANLSTESPETHFEEDEGLESKRNFIHSMALDDTGERLAVMFSTYDNRCRCIALFTVSCSPLLTLSQSGFINGEEGTFPTFIAFKPNYAKGALLTICYSNGLISYIPMYFQPVIKNNSNMLQITPTKHLSFMQNNSTLDHNNTVWSTVG